MNLDFGFQLILLYSNWVVLGIIIVTMVISKVSKRLDLVLPCLLIIMLNSFLSTFEFEGLERNKKNKEKVLALAGKILRIFTI